MSFAHPEAFSLFAVLAIFVFIAVYNFQKKNKLIEAFISSTAYKRLGIRSGREIDFFKTSLITLALAFFIIALAGPQWGEQFENVEIRGIEMVFLLDTSYSMNAEDLKPNRLDVAKQLIGSIVDNLTTDYVGLINFAAVPFVQCPLTTDYEAFKMMTDASMISPDEEQGTDFGKGLQLALKTIEKTQGEHKVMVLITDGEDQEKSWQQTMPEIKNQNIVIFSVGIGIVSGAPIPMKNERGETTGWKKDKSGNIVKTQLDENTLIQVASQTGGQYFRLTDSASIDSLINNLKNYQRSVLAKKVQANKIKRFHYPLLLGLILLIVELLLSEKRIQWKKD
ncbi:MAG: VWA domain-containing protein [Acidobacteria bacterium]|jgi:Ca-activated chloride channel family protein|nr:VWA domain-containing protein [Acidobacteriota bacterium]